MKQNVQSAVHRDFAGHVRRRKVFEEPTSWQQVRFSDHSSCIAFPQIDENHVCLELLPGKIKKDR